MLDTGANVWGKNCEESNKI